MRWEWGGSEAAWATSVDPLLDAEVLEVFYWPRQHRFGTSRHDGSLYELWVLGHDLDELLVA